MLFNDKNDRQDLLNTVVIYFRSQNIVRAIKESLCNAG